MSSSTIYEQLPVVSKKLGRHPIVVGCHIPYIILLTLTFVTCSSFSLGQCLYFTVTIGMYVSSTAYHSYEKNNALYVVDQMLISWFILATPLPFIEKETWAIPLFVVGCALSALNKWYEWERCWRQGSLVFLLQGVVSFGLTVFVGFTTSGIGYNDWAAWCVYLATAFFIGKLVVYHYELHLVIRGVTIRPPDLGHFLLSDGVTLLTGVVVLCLV